MTRLSGMYLLAENLKSIAFLMDKN